MKASKLRELTDDELTKKVDDYKGELFNLRFQLATGHLDNPHENQRSEKGYRQGENRTERT